MYREIDGTAARHFLDDLVKQAVTQKVDKDSQQEVMLRLLQLTQKVNTIDLVEYERVPWLNYGVLHVPGRWKMTKRSPLTMQTRTGQIPNVGKLTDGNLFLYIEPGNTYGESGFRHIGFGAEIGFIDETDALYLKYTGKEPRALPKPHEVILIPRPTVYQILEQRRRDKIGQV